LLQISEVLKSITAISAENKPDNPRENGYAGEFITKSPGRYQADQPPVVVWNINNRCNMTCPHCYSAAKVHDHADELSDKDIRKIIDMLWAYGVKIIILSGGEPLLREDLPGIISYITERNIKCHLSSNGVLLSQDQARLLKSSGLVYVGVSLDGLADFNDSYRGMENGFDKALIGTRNAMSAGLSTGIRMTVTKSNSHHIFPLIDEVSREGVPRFYLSHLVYGGRGKAYSKHDLEHHEVREIMESLFNKALKLTQSGAGPSIVTGGNDADNVLFYFFIKRHFNDSDAARALEILRSRGGNSAGEKLINIDHLGNVHPDQFWQSSRCGNLLSKSLEDIMDSGLMVQLRKREEHLKGKCALCRYRSICRGSHRERALAVFDDLWAPDPACYLSHEEIAT